MKTWKILLGLTVFFLMVNGYGETSPEALGAPLVTGSSSKVTNVTPMNPPVAIQGQKWANVLKEAAKEGVVTVYSGAGPKVKDVIVKAMKERYGIEAQFVIGRSAEVSQKITVERRAGLYLTDALLMGAIPIIEQLTPAGALTPLAPLLVLPEVTNPKAWPDGKPPYFTDKKLSIVLNQAYISYILVNSDLVPHGAIRSYLDLLKPEWKGKIVLFDPINAGAGNTMSVYLLAFIFGYERGEKFLQDLANQEPAIVKDTRLQVEWVARGRYSIGLAASQAVLPQFQSVGAPLKLIRASEGGLVTAGSSLYSVMDKAPHPSAATVLTNWLLTAEGQSAVSQAYGQPATRLGVPTAGIDPASIMIPGEKVYFTDESFYATHTNKAAPIIKKIFGPLLK